MKVCMQQFLQKDYKITSLKKHTEKPFALILWVSTLLMKHSIISGRQFYLPTTNLNTFPHNLRSSRGSQTENLKKSK